MLKCFDTVCERLRQRKTDITAIAYTSTVLYMDTQWKLQHEYQERFSN